jgi:hypothetical protein
MQLSVMELVGLPELVVAVFDGTHALDTIKHNLIIQTNAPTPPPT